MLTGSAFTVHNFHYDRRLSESQFYVDGVSPLRYIIVTTTVDYLSLDVRCYCYHLVLVTMLRITVLGTCTLDMLLLE